MNQLAPQLAGLARLQDLRRFGMRLGLSRIREALVALGQPHLRYAAIHVAGTNGKGSTAAMIASCLRQARVRTGLFTSPHLHRFSERITVDGEEIGPRALAELIERVIALDPRLTFFEVATVVAMSDFARRDIDCGIFETGLGGRLDATNVLMPEVVVLTSISRDHTEILGEDLAAIAAEKAGIIKQGVPVVAAWPAAAAIRGVIARRCDEVGAPLRWIDDAAARRLLEGLTVGLEGAHQRLNAALAVAAARELASRRVLRLPVAGLARGLAGVQWPGRMERVGEFLLDCAHNPAGARCLARALERDDHCLIFGCLDDKPAASLLEPLLACCGRVILAPVCSSRSAQPARVEQEIAPKLRGKRITVASSAAHAIELAKGDPRPKLVAGSVYLVGEVRALLLGSEPTDPVTVSDPVRQSISP